MANDDNYDVEADIDRLPGDPVAKLRTKVVIRVLSGKMLPKEACRLLQIDEAELKQFQLLLAESAMRAATEMDPEQN